MFFGFSVSNEDGQFVVVAAAPSIAEFNTLPERLAALNIAYEVPDGIEFLMDDRVRGFAYAIIIPEEAAQAFPDISLVHKNRALTEQRKMAATDEHDMFDPAVEKRTIAEIYGLTDHDPWDKRTEEEKAAIADKKKKKEDVGDVSGDSFSGPIGTKVAQVSDSRITVDKDGNVTGVDAIAVKGHYNPDEEPALPTTAGGFTPTAILITCDKDFSPVLDGLIHDFGIEKDVEYGPGWLTTKNPMVASQLMYSLPKRNFEVKATLVGDEFEHDLACTHAVGVPPFSMFYRLDVSGIGLEDAVDILAEGFVKLDSLLGRGEGPDGIWFGVAVERLARDYAALLAADGPHVTFDVYAVSQTGERMAPKGVTVSDPNATPEYGPRPWADLAAWEALTDDERAVEVKAIKGAEFIFTSSYAPGQGTTVVFTPRAYFQANNCPWQGDLDPYLSGILPDLALVLQSNGTYITRSIENASAVFKLARAGFGESMLLRIWLNLDAA